MLRRAGSHLCSRVLRAHDWPAGAILGGNSGLSSLRLFSGSASRFATGNEVIGIDLGTTNSCVAVMEGKVGDVLHSRYYTHHLHWQYELTTPILNYFCRLLK